MNRKKPVGRQPLTSHPLFPAIVALWFGALFGLGSLAIRPALIEELVVAGGIDSVIPMAAPPLGMTTRILLALAMTAIGGLIGALIARQLSRPKQEQRERRRSPKSAAAPAVELPAEAAAAASPRRRALAMADDQSPFEARDDAPVPGHSARILDVTEFELEGFEQLADEDTAPVDRGFDRSAAIDRSGVDQEREPAFLTDEAGLNDIDEPEEALEMPAFTNRASQPPADAQVFAPRPGFSLVEPEPESDRMEYELDETRAMAPLPEPEAKPDFADADRSSFQVPAMGPSADPLASDDEHAPTTSGASLNNRLFEAYSREIAARAERAADAEARPLFEREEANATEHSPRPQLLPRLGLGDWDETDSDDASEPDPEHHAPLFPHLRSRADEASVVAEPEAEWSDVEDADDAIAAAPSEREAEETTLEVRSDAAWPDAELDAEYTEDTENAVSEEQVQDEPQDHANPAAPHALEDDDEGQSAAQRIASSELHELSPVELLERLAMSMAQRRIKIAPVVANIPDPEPETEISNPWSDILPVSTDDPAAQEDAEPESPIVQTRVPAALRPISFDAESEDDELPGYVPPRSIGMTSNASVTAMSGTAGDLDDSDNACEDDDTDALEEGYSSLLNLSRPFERPQFVRIDEPEAEDEVRPFVVFPGENATRRDDHAASSFDETFNEERRFDPPAASDSHADAEETERKLRAALANLQRISGAA